MEKLIGIVGILTLLGVAVGLSNNRKHIPWKLVGTLLAMDVMLALVILKIPGTSDFFFMVGQGINKLLDFANDGAVFALGHTLVFGEFFKPGSTGQTEFIFAIRVGFSIIFISGLAALGYYFGILPRVIKFMAKILVKLGLSGPEALSCSAAAFVGQVECQLLIKPYMKTLTKSELFTTMTAAMATISGSALVAYTSIGMPATPLIAASLMSAIGGIIMSKIVCPETEFGRLQKEVDMALPHDGVNAFDAAAHGVSAGTEIAIKVVTMVAFAIGFMALVNWALGAGLSVFGLHAQIQDVFAYPFMPIAWLMGVPWHECFHVGRLMATELLFNEFVSYGELAPVIHGAGPYVLAAKTQLIATAALCGFAHLGSLGINIGGLGAMAPERRGEIAGIAFKSMMVANMATWLTATICGLIY